VDALVRRIEGTLGRGTLDGAPVTADEIRASNFRTRRGGYHEVVVDYALEAFLVAIETRPAEPQTPEAWSAAEAEKVERAAFRPGRLGLGYDEDEVDAFLDRIVATLRGTTDQPVTCDDVRAATFTTVMLRPGYAVADVDAFLAGVAETLEHGVSR
jgi:DivIVA domain-containing protein